MAEKSNFRLSSGILSFVQTRFIPQKSVLPCFEKNENKSRQNFAIFLKEKSLASTTPRFDRRPEKKQQYYQDQTRPEYPEHIAFLADSILGKKKYARFRW